jgi:hypothetical protein
LVGHYGIIITGGRFLAGGAVREKYQYCWYNNDDGAGIIIIIIIKYYYYQVLMRLAVQAGRVLFREDSWDWGYWRDGNTCSTSTG